MAVAELGRPFPWARAGPVGNSLRRSSKEHPTVRTLTVDSDRRLACQWDGRPWQPVHTPGRWYQYCTNWDRQTGPAEALTVARRKSYDRRPYGPARRALSFVLSNEEPN